MDSIDHLEKAIHELSTCVTPWQRPSREKAVLLYGARVRTWTQEIYTVLDKQLRWLDTHVDSPTYEQRFGEWETLLRDYERSVRALNAAAGLNIGVAA